MVYQLSEKINLLVLITLFALAYAKHEQYVGWKSYYVEATTDEQVKILNALGTELDLDFLSQVHAEQEALVLVQPEHQEIFITTLDNLGIKYRTHVDDIKSVLDNDDKIIIDWKKSIARNGSRLLPYNNYQRLDVIYDYMAFIHDKYQNITTIVSAGPSFEKRPIKYMKISTTNFQNKSKPVIFIDAGTHAREWNTPPSVTWAIRKLTENVTEPDLLNNFDWILIPVVNPDGYEFSFTNKRPIKYMKISTTNFQNKSKPVIFIDAGTHAREWNTPPSVTWAIRKLTENVTEPDLLNNFDWILIPVVNSDGYEFSFTNKRPIKYMKISTTNFQNKSKPVIFIDAGTHAREWNTPPSVTWTIRKLTENVTEPDLLNNFHWILIPVVNPDGYEFSFTNDRFWRKTRSTNTHFQSKVCPGVDGNRNYDIVWNTVRSSDDPCSNIYSGNRAFSEAETRVVRDILLEHRARMALYISMHSYGSMILYPWVHTKSSSRNYHALKSVGMDMANAIHKLALRYFPRYVVGNPASNVSYLCSGTSFDYAHSIGVRLAYTFELPGVSKVGASFNMEPKYIEQVCRETWAGVAVGARRARGLLKN